MIRLAARPALTLAALLIPLAGAPARAAGPSVDDRLAALERASGGRLGVAAMDADGRLRVAYRAGERFPFCSTFKVMLAGAVLQRSAQDKGLLDRRIRYTQRDMVAYSPVSSKHLADGMTVSGLCAAALQVSDNSAANVLIDLVGGTDAVTAFARGLGDTAFRLDNRETALNAATPGNPRNTTTPEAMAGSLRRLALGDALAPAGRARLVEWLKGSTTGLARIRAGVPGAWSVGDKTGTGDYGTTNDVAVVWPPGQKPFVLAVYFTQRAPGAAARNDVVARAARLVADGWGAGAP